MKAPIKILFTLYIPGIHQPRVSSGIGRVMTRLNFFFSSMIDSYRKDKSLGFISSVALQVPPHPRDVESTNFREISTFASPAINIFFSLSSNQTSESVYFMNSKHR